MSAIPGATAIGRLPIAVNVRQAKLAVFADPAIDRP